MMIDERRIDFDDYFSEILEVLEEEQKLSRDPHISVHIAQSVASDPKLASVHIAQSVASDPKLVEGCNNAVKHNI